MPTKEEWEKSSLTELAALCGTVAESPYADAETKGKASHLKQEWKMLLEQKESGAAIEALKKRMADFWQAHWINSLLKKKMGIPAF